MLLQYIIKDSRINYENLFFIFSLSLTLFLSLLHQANSGPNDPVNIPDSALRTAIETKLGKSPGDTITESEMNSMTGQLSAPDKNISDLTGLEHATGIDNFLFRENDIEDLSPLANLTQLETLNVSHNLVTNLSPLANLTNLTTLSIDRDYTDSSAKITDISTLSGLTNLQALRLAANSIVDISPLFVLTSLTHLGLSDNPITDISDLRLLTALTHLDLEYNQLTDISPLRNLTALKVLFLTGNWNISDFSPLGSLTNLETLWLGATSITESKLSAVLPFLLSLDYLIISSTPISDLSVLERLPSGVVLENLLLNAMHDPPRTSSIHRGWLLKDISPLVRLMNAGHLGSATRSLDMRLNWLLDYDALYTHIPALLDSGIQNLRYSPPTPEIRRKSVENHVGRPRARHTFVVQALNTSSDYRHSFAPTLITEHKVNKNFKGVPVTWTVTGPDGSETVVGNITGDDGLASVSIMLSRNHGDVHTVEAVVPAKQPANGPTHPELKVVFTATVNSTAPIVSGLTVNFEDYPENPPIDEFPLTIIFSEPVTGFEKEGITIETELKTDTGAAPSFEERDVPIETPLKTYTATLKALTPVDGTVVIPVDGPEQIVDAEVKVRAQTYTATIGVPADATGTVRLIVHAGAVLSSTSGQVGPATDTASEPIEFGQPLSSKKGTFLHASKVAMDKVIFNEIRNAEDDKNDWIELKNISDEDVPLGDWEISIVIESAPKMIRNRAELSKEDVDIVVFPEDYTLPAGGILLIVNTHPNETDLIEGQEITDEESDIDMPPQYLIASEMKLPNVPYLLILRSATDKNGKPEAFEDLAGTYFRGFVDYGTQVFPLVHTFRPANHKAAVLTQGQAWQRIDVKKRGYTKEAWAVSGHQSGIGYKPGSALETSLGTPGYPNDIVVDDSLAGRITFSEMMYATRGGLFSQPQWIELYNNTAMAAKPLDLEGWKLVIEARDSEICHRYSVIELQELSIATAQTVLLVTRDRRHSGHLREGQVYNLFRHDSSRLKLGLRENAVLPAAGFALKLLAPDGTLVDSAGNLDGKTGIDTPTWALPSGYTEDGARTSLIRRYEDTTALVGTEATSWVRAADVALPLEVYYGHKTDIGSPGYKEGGVAPVMLSHFRARRTEAGVIVEWTTVSETDNAGFNILRSQTKKGQFVKVNPTLIFGAGTTAERQNYTWIDVSAKPNKVYYYQLEEVSLAGEVTRLATVRLKGFLSASGKRLWHWGALKQP